ncbi:hypothetical protein KP509_02G051600 [Ceratopteris richardii]|nr:hypothetical protein KP509_02G051600 [Ceratopteris richardii]
MALYATDDVRKIRTQWSHKAVPRFYGNKVEGTIYGKRMLWLDAHHEAYEITCPKLLIRLFPVPGTEWVGTSTIKCVSTKLEANLLFKGKPLFGLRGTAGHVSGKIYDVSTSSTLYEINGAWNKTITAKNLKTEESSLLYDAQAALSNLQPLVVQNKGLDASESLVVWRSVMSGIVNWDWEAARQAKHEIEERQRDLEKKRKMDGKLWRPRHFVQVDGEDHWQWCHFGEAVSPAPLVMQSCYVETEKV